VPVILKMKNYRRNKKKSLAIIALVSLSIVLISIFSINQYLPTINSDYDRKLRLSADSDGDGLEDDDEINNYGTDPFNNDTDDDGLLDGEEVLIYGTYPIYVDSDSDGVLDGEEVLIYGTDPLDSDTDSDGITDSYELFNLGTDPLSFRDPGYFPISIYKNEDFESLGFPGNGTEFNPYIIEDLTIIHRSKTLIHIEDTTAYFIIRNCELDAIRGSTWGIRLKNASYGSILDNLVYNTVRAICLEAGSHDNLVSNNTIRDNTNYGILLGAFNNTIINNEIYNTKTDGIWGGGRDNIITNNIIHDNDRAGIFYYTAKNNTIKDNTIYNNQYGIYIYIILIIQQSLIIKYLITRIMEFHYMIQTRIFFLRIQS